MLALALILDAIFGEPDWLWKRFPHPAVVMGNFIRWLDTTLNRGTGRKAKGIAALIALLIPVYIIARILSLDIFFGVFEILGAAILLAHRSLIEHVRAVAEGLRTSPEAGRRAVAMIVGRETAQMGEAEASRAAIESAAENFSDGVIAPAFWFLLLGLPGIALYKAVNTADSMIGYRTEHYEEFGWAAARLDDVLNWLPARLSALLIVFAGVIRRRDREQGFVRDFSERFDAVMEEAPRHRSPNAGWPEAAVAHSLDLALSGPRIYDGTLTDDPFVNEDGEHALEHGDIDDTIALLWRTWTTFTLPLALLLLLQVI